MKTGARESQGGFSLMEVLTVLALLALTVVIALPLLKTSGAGRTFRAEAQQVAALFRLARIDALAGNQERRVVVDLERRRIFYEGGRAKEIELDPQTDIVAKTARGEVVLRDAGFRFMPGGGATGGALHLKRGSDEATIAISWVTGAVRLYYGGAR